MVTFHENLKRHRKKAGLTQAEVAQRLGFSPGRYCQIEGGAGSPTLDLIYRLAKALGVSAGVLVDDTRPDK
jgi:transcriptional regulator with XRE-family HTH domain